MRWVIPLILFTLVLSLSYILGCVHGSQPCEMQREEKNEAIAAWEKCGAELAKEMARAEYNYAVNKALLTQLEVIK